MASSKLKFGHATVIYWVTVVAKIVINAARVVYILEGGS